MKLRHGLVCVALFSFDESEFLENIEEESEMSKFKIFSFSAIKLIIFFFFIIINLFNLL